MNAVASGEVQLLSEIYQRYSKGLYNYFIRLNNSSNNAEDLVQNVFEKLLKYSASYTDNKRFKPWLFTIARNVNIDFHRGRKYDEIDDTKVNQISDHRTAYHEMVQEERARFLRQAVAQLEGLDRELILLTKFERMKYAEVASMFEMSENAVKVKTHRAMKKLKALVIKDTRYE